MVKHSIILSVTITFMGIAVWLMAFLITQWFFLGVYDHNLFSVPFLVVNIMSVGLLHRKMPQLRLGVSGLLMLVYLALFILFKPSYTVGAAIESLKEDGYNNMQIGSPSTFQTTEPLGFCIRRVYLLSDGERSIYFNPANGTYSVSD